MASSCRINKGRIWALAVDEKPKGLAKYTTGFLLTLIFREIYTGILEVRFYGYDMTSANTTLVTSQLIQRVDRFCRFNTT